MPVVKGAFATPEFTKKIKQYWDKYMNQPIEPVTEDKEFNPAQVLSQVLAQADFDHLDLGAKTFALLKSMASDIVEGGHQYSLTTQEYCQEIIDMLAESLDDLRSPEDDEDEDEDEDVFPSVLTGEDEGEEDDEDESDEELADRLAREAEEAEVDDDDDDSLLDSLRDDLDEAAEEKENESESRTN